MDNPSLYTPIGRVAEILQVETHVIRFWESKLPQIKPKKIIGNRRFYTKSEIDQLLYVKNELYNKGLTIRGLQQNWQKMGDNPSVDPGVNPGVNEKKSLVFYQNINKIRHNIESARALISQILKN